MFVSGLNLFKSKPPQCLPHKQKTKLLSSSPKSLNNPNIDNESAYTKLLTYISYSLLLICDGGLEPLGGTLYVQLESQLDTSFQILHILSLKAIFSAIGSIIGAIVLQYVDYS